MKISFLNKQFYLFTFLIGFSFIGDILRRISIYFNHPFTRYSSASKIIFIAVGLFFLMLNYKEIVAYQGKKKMLILIIGLILIFFTGQLVYNGGWDNSIIINIEYLGKYLFFPFTLLLFLDLRESDVYIKKLLTIVEVIFFINIFSIFIGVLFEIEIFKTYSGTRLGYKGIYSMSGQTSLYFILIIFYYMHQLIFDKLNFRILSKLLVVITFSLFLGTKRIYFFIPMLILYYFIFLNGFKRKSSLRVAFLFLLFLFLFYNQVKVVLLKTQILFYNIYLEKGFLSSLTSFRTDLLIDILETRINSSWIYLIGGLDFSIGRSEMGFFDLGLFFGAIGLVIYMYFYKVIIQFNFKHHFYWFCFFTLLLLTFFADAVLLDTNVPILLFLIASYFNLYEKKRK